MRFLICLLTVSMLIPATVGAANPAADLEARRKALNDLLHERWEYTMRTSPIYASILGDKRYNDKLDDFSQHWSAFFRSRMSRITKTTSLD